MVFEDLGPKALDGPTLSSDLTWYDRPSCVGPGIAFERRELPANAADGGGQLLLARRRMGYCPDFTIQLPGGMGLQTPALRKSGRPRSTSGWRPSQHGRQPRVQKKKTTNRSNP